MKTRLLLTAVALAAGVANAATFSVDLTTVFSGTTPSGGPIWGTATFTDVANTSCGGSSLGCVQLTMAGNLSASNFISEWDFNVLQAGLTGLGITAGTLTGVDAPAIDQYSSNSYKADGDGWYDFGFRYPTGSSDNRFTGTDSAIFYITGIGASVTSASFNTASQLSSSLGSYVTAAHIQGILVGTQTCSGWVGGITNTAGSTSGASPGGCNPVPEPIHSGLFLTGALGAVVFLARKRLFGQA